MQCRGGFKRLCAPEPPHVNRGARHTAPAEVVGLADGASLEMDLMPVMRGLRYLEVDFVPAAIGWQVHRVQRHDKRQPSVNTNVKLATACFGLFPDFGVQHHRCCQPSRRARRNVKHNFGGWLEKEGLERIRSHSDIPRGQLFRRPSHNPRLGDVFEALERRFRAGRGTPPRVNGSGPFRVHARFPQPLFESRRVPAQMPDLDLKRGKILFLKLGVVRMKQVEAKSVFHDGARRGACVKNTRGQA